MSPYISSSRDSGSTRAAPTARCARKGAPEPRVGGHRRHGADEDPDGYNDNGNCSERSQSSSTAIRSTRKSLSSSSAFRGSHEQQRKSRRHFDEPYEQGRRSGKDRDHRRQSLEAATPSGRHRALGRHCGDEAERESGDYVDPEPRRSKERRSFRTEGSERRRSNRHRAADEQGTLESTEESHPGCDDQGDDECRDDYGTRGRTSTYSRRSLNYRYHDGSSGSSHVSDDDAGHSRHSQHPRSHRGANSGPKNSPGSRNGRVLEDSTTSSSRRSYNDDHCGGQRQRQPGINGWLDEYRGGSGYKGSAGRDCGHNDPHGKALDESCTSYRGHDGGAGGFRERDSNYGERDSSYGGRGGNYGGRGGNNGGRGGSYGGRGGSYGGRGGSYGGRGDNYGCRGDSYGGRGDIYGGRGGGPGYHGRDSDYSDGPRAGNHGQGHYDSSSFGRSGDQSGYHQGGYAAGNEPGAVGKKDLSDLLAQINAIKLDTSLGRPANFIRDFYIEHPAVEQMTLEQAQYERDSREITFHYPEDVNEVPKPVLTFEQSSFPEPITKLLNAKFSAPTAVQVQGWPVALSGHDTIAIAETGSGKTLAYVLPGLVHIQAQPAVAPRDGPIMLILAPTRELAEQIGIETRQFASIMKQRVVTLFGQMDHSMLQSSLQTIEAGVHSVVACPGKLMDLFNKRSINFNRVTYFVLDEADRLLDMGFKPQITAISSVIYPDRQVLMWSATWPEEVRLLADEVFLGKEPPYHFQVGVGKKVVKTVMQAFINCQRGSKEREFARVMTENANRLTLVFCNTKKTVDWLAGTLTRMTNNSIYPVTIHGGLDGHLRRSNLDLFRRKQKNCLIATELASRGLDIPNIQLVVNYDCPETLENYIHRVGRTGRVGRPGESITFIQNDDEYRCREFFRGIIPNLLANDQPVPQWLQQRVAATVGGNCSGAAPWDLPAGDSNNLGTNFGAEPFNTAPDDEWGGNSFS